MTLEISLKLPFSIPRGLHAQKDEPRRNDAHWLGQKQEQAQKPPEFRKSPETRNQDARGYRPLSEITIGEVDEIARFYGPQLASAPLEGWIRKNYFCMVHLKRMGRTRPAAVFGRVKSCYPGESHVENIQEAELYFPHLQTPPDVVQIHSDDINRQVPASVQSYCLKVQFLLSDEELEEFKDSDPLFADKGFVPNLDMDLIHLLDMNEENLPEQPWLYVIGSRWFDEIPESMVGEIKWKLDKILEWDRKIVNYHPDWLPKEINPLNKILGYKYKLTHRYLTEPENPKQTAKIVATLFDEIFLHKQND